MNRGQRIAELLKDPSDKEKFISNWLLLFAVYTKPGIKLDELEEAMKGLWEIIHNKDPRFCLNYGSYSDGHNYQHLTLGNAVTNSCELGLLRTSDFNSFYLTNAGASILLDGIFCHMEKLKDCFLILVSND